MMQRYEGRWDWTIDMAQRGFAPGEITFVLGRSAAPGSHGDLEARAVYIHHGRWGNESAAVECSW